MDHNDAIGFPAAFVLQQKRQASETMAADPLGGGRVSLLRWLPTFCSTFAPPANAGHDYDVHCWLFVTDPLGSRLDVALTERTGILFHYWILVLRSSRRGPTLRHFKLELHGLRGEREPPTFERSIVGLEMLFSEQTPLGCWKSALIFQAPLLSDSTFLSSS